jgi:hypothetical protein
MKRFILPLLASLFVTLPARSGPVEGTFKREVTLKPKQRAFYALGFKGGERAGTMAVAHDTATAKLVLRVYDRDGKLVVADGEDCVVSGQWEPSKGASYSIIVYNNGGETVHVTIIASTPG